MEKFYLFLVVLTRKLVICHSFTIKTLRMIVWLKMSRTLFESSLCTKLEMKTFVVAGGYSHLELVWLALIFCYVRLRGIIALIHLPFLQARAIKLSGVEGVVAQIHDSLSATWLRIFRSARTYCKLCRFIAAAPAFYTWAKSGGRATRTEREKEASVGHINKCKKPQFHIFLSATPCAYSSVHAERVREIKAPRERESYIKKSCDTRAQCRKFLMPFVFWPSPPRQRLFWNYRSSPEQALELQFMVGSPLFNALHFSCS